MSFTAKRGSTFSGEHIVTSKMKQLTPIGSISIIDELRKAAEREKGVTRGCSRCGDSGFEIVEGKGARKCDHTINDVDQLRERVAIEVMDLPDDQAQAEYNRRTR